MNLENAYLEYLKIYLNTKEENGPLFRTFVDNWFAYSEGSPFLNSRGKPKWFNNPNPVKERDALLAMHFKSKDAMRIIYGKQEGRLMKDHSIPIKILRILICEELGTGPGVSKIKQFLKKYYRIGVITKKEDMPENWDRSNVFARYKKVNII